mmetsp:Transcript_31764/g.73735  ORF Transcript_31764/g.73735 Transcript_31764/m.73735 type:complete len:214 (-) Transcript_31764:135-776(-)
MGGHAAWASLLLLGLATVEGSSSTGDSLAFIQQSVGSHLQGAADEAGNSGEAAFDEEEDEDVEGLEESDSDGVYYLHFRLADGETSAFEVGASAEVNVARCLKGGAWATCKITGAGSVPGTFDISIPANPVGHQDMRSIPARALRNDGGAPFGGQVGDMASVNVARCLEGGSWSDCKITGIGSQQGTYNVEVLDGGERQHLKDVPLKALRKKV